MPSPRPKFVKYRIWLSQDPRSLGELAGMIQDEVAELQRIVSGRSSDRELITSEFDALEWVIEAAGNILDAAGEIRYAVDELKAEAEALAEADAEAADA